LASVTHIAQPHLNHPPDLTHYGPIIDIPHHVDPVALLQRSLKDHQEASQVEVLWRHQHQAGKRQRKINYDFELGQPSLSIRVFCNDLRKVRSHLVGRSEVQPKFQKLKHLKLCFNKLFMLKSPLGNIYKIANTHIVRNGSAFVKLNINRFYLYSQQNGGEKI
jgi:hypothetical protein